MNVADDNETHDRCASTRAAAGRPRQHLSARKDRWALPLETMRVILDRFLAIFQAFKRGNEVKRVAIWYIQERNAKRADKIYHGACESPEQTAPRSYDQHARAQECVVTMEGA